MTNPLCPSFTFRKYDGYRFTRPRMDSRRLFYVCNVVG
jgi:hypothetical protein